MLMATPLFLLLASFCGSCYSGLVCLANNQGVGPAQDPCEFPFVFDGQAFNKCIANVSGGDWCPTKIDYNRIPVTGRWGVCQCTYERICEELKELQGVKGKVETSMVKDPYHPILNCTWHVTNPVHASQTVPTTIFFATQYRIVDADVVVKDNKDRHQIMSIRGGDNVAWTTQKEFWVHLMTEGGSTSPEVFHGSYYSGFCSDVDGDMDLPAYDFQISDEPYIPLITDKYLIPGNTSQLNGTYDFDYRANSYCNWIIPAYASTFTGKLKNLYFYKFDLGEGDSIDVFVENRYHGMEKIHSFTRDNPPIPISTFQKMEVTFISDGKSQGLGFQADIYRETCSPRTVNIQANYGTIHDGSSSGVTYKPRLSCSWHINKPGETIIIELTYYELFPNDAITIFEGTGLDGRLLAVYSGNSSELITLTGQNDIFITFKTQDRTLSFGNYGFSLTWKVCDAKCKACGTGTYYDFVKGICEVCPTWSISQGGSYKCYPCDKGHKWTSPSKCEACYPGTYSNDGRTCVDCAPGLVAESEGMHECLRCQNHTYASNGTICAPCGAGFETNDTGTGCREIPVPPTPKNNTAVLIYGGVGIGVLILIGAGIGYTQWKKNQSYSHEYLPLPSFT